MTSRIAILLAALPTVAVGAAGDIRFQEVAASWGLDFRHRHGGTGDFYMIETMGSGVLIFDYDADGDQDVLFVDSGPLPLAPDGGPRSGLFRNEGSGVFVEVSHRSGLLQTSYGMGATAGDVDGDGDLDLYLTAFGDNQLLRNQGDGSFRDVTATAAVGDPLWSASAAFADPDADGDLDLYVTNYVDFSFERNPLCGDPQRALRSYCHPDVYEGLPDRYYRNRGDGTFEDATRAAGFGAAAGKGLGVVFGDVNRDGAVDLYVANDMTPNFLFVNRSNGEFEDQALMSGTAFGDRGAPEAGMGLALGDLDGDGQPEIMSTHLDLESNALYSSIGSGLFVDRRFAAGIAEPSYNKVGFGVDFCDLDHDADLDIVIANGHIIHNIEQWERGGAYKQQNQVFENLGGGRFRELAGVLIEVRSSRGLAVGDLDGDGDLDLVINNSNDASEVYRNDSVGRGGWLQLDLATDERGVNRFGIGATIELIGGGTTQRREVRTASSYLSQNALTVHFGVKDRTAPEALVVRWPDGGRQRFLAPPVGRRLQIGR